MLEEMYLQNNGTYYHLQCICHTYDMFIHTFIYMHSYDMSGMLRLSCFGTDIFSNIFLC